MHCEWTRLRFQCFAMSLSIYWIHGFLKKSKRTRAVQDLFIWKHKCPEEMKKAFHALWPFNQVPGYAAKSHKYWFNEYRYGGAQERDNYISMVAFVNTGLNWYVGGFALCRTARFTSKIMPVPLHGVAVTTRRFIFKNVIRKSRPSGVWDCFRLHSPLQSLVQVLRRSTTQDWVGILRHGALLDKGRCHLQKKSKHTNIKNLAVTCFFFFVIRNSHFANEPWGRRCRSWCYCLPLRRATIWAMASAVTVFRVLSWKLQANATGY